MNTMPTLSFCGGSLDRGDGLRRDEPEIAALLEKSGALILPLWKGEVFIERTETGDHRERLRFISADSMSENLGSQSETLFLGLAGETPVFTTDLSALDENRVKQITGNSTTMGLRQAGALLSPEQGGIIAYAGSLLHWHRHNRFCGRCGSKTESHQGGRARACSNSDCAHEHYPRTDPAVIMLVVHKPSDGSPERCLLGHHSRYREGMYSTLAGFVEPGETLEQAVAREVKEETGVTVSSAHYFASQPWPFPSSLMVGFYAEAATTTITVDNEELTDAKWFSRKELAAVINRTADDSTGATHIPGSDSIAHLLITTWLKQTSAD